MEGLYDSSVVCVCACVPCTTWQMALWAAVGRRRRRRRHLLLSARWCHTAGKMEEEGGNSIRPLSLPSLFLVTQMGTSIAFLRKEGRKPFFPPSALDGTDEERLLEEERKRRWYNNNNEEDKEGGGAFSSPSSSPPGIHNRRTSIIRQRQKPNSHLSLSLSLLSSAQKQPTYSSSYHRRCALQANRQEPNGGRRRYVRRYACLEEEGRDFFYPLLLVRQSRKNQGTNEPPYLPPFLLAVCNPAASHAPSSCRKGEFCLQISKQSRVGWEGKGPSAMAPS